MVPCLVKPKIVATLHLFGVADRKSNQDPGRMLPPDRDAERGAGAGEEKLKIQPVLPFV